MSNPRIAYLNRWRKADLYDANDTVFSHPEYQPDYTQGDIPGDFWRSMYGTGASRGRFQVGASNANLDFTLDGNKTATISSNVTYNSTSLAAEIQTQLQSFGNNCGNFSVSYSPGSGKFLFSCSAAFIFRWANGASSPANGNNTSIADVIGFNSATDTASNTLISADERRNYYLQAPIRGDLLTAVDINFAALIKHNITANANYAGVQGTANSNMAGGNYVTIYLPGAGNNNYITPGNHFCYFAENFTYQYWRLLIRDYTNPAGYSQCGPFFLGKWYELNRPPVISYSRGKVDPSELYYSDSMSVYALERPRLDTWTYTWRGLSDVSANVVLNLMEECGVHKPWVFCLDGANNNTTSNYVRLTDLNMPERERANYWSWTATLQEVV